MNECMNWTGARFVNGYGQAKINGRKIRVHRFIWEWLHGRKLEPWPQEVVMHTCDNRLCINPEHLVVGTQRDNLNDMRSKGRGYFPPRKTHCKRGHELTAETVYVYKGAREGCKKCKVENLRAWRAGQ